MIHGVLKCTPYQDGSYDLEKIELDKGTQVGDSWCIGMLALPKKFIINHFHLLLHCRVSLLIIRVSQGSNPKSVVNRTR